MRGGIFVSSSSGTPCGLLRVLRADYRPRRVPALRCAVLNVRAGESLLEVQVWSAVPMNSVWHTGCDTQIARVA